jgi:hypothetical protein
MTTKDNIPITPEGVVEQLRLIRQNIPEYSQRTAAASVPLRNISITNVRFVEACINAIGASAELQDALRTTPEALRLETGEMARWSAVEDELRAMLKGVASANLTRRHRVCLAALQAYNITRQLVRQPENADLLPHFDEMRRLNPFGRRRAKPLPPADAEPLPVPTPKS